MRCVFSIAREMRYHRRIVAHRGLHEQFPENSAEAFRAAWEAGFLTCECDIHASADGAPVIIHDETLDRTTTGSGRVRDFPWSALRRLNLRDAAGNPTKLRIPLLRDVLDEMPTDRVMLIEIKPPDCPALVRRAVRLVGPYRGRMIMSFNPANLRHARQIDPVMMLGLLAECPTTVSLGGFLAYLFGHSKTTEEDVRRLKAEPKLIGFWTVNEDGDIERVLRWDPDWIISDRPQRVRELQDIFTDERPRR